MHKNVYKISVKFTVILEFEIEVEIQKYQKDRLSSKRTTKAIYLRPDGI